MLPPFGLLDRIPTFNANKTRCPTVLIEPTMKPAVADQKLNRTAFADGPRLLADIGATHARFALQTAPGEFRAVSVLKCDDYPDMLALLRSYLADHKDVALKHAALAVANPVSGDQVRMTNRDWEFSTDTLRRALGLHTLLVVNDFTALAMSLPGLKPADLMQIGGGTPANNSVIGLLGPGTGLGVSGVIPTVDGFVTLGSEGGHTNFAPSDEREYSILQYAWQTWSHVSTERLISGPGMEIIYRAIAKRNGRQVRDLTSQEIMAGALTDKDPLCLEVLECFCAMLGGYRQPGRDAGCLRRHVHRRRHRAAHGRVVRLVAVPFALRGQGPFHQLPVGDSDLCNHHAEPGVLWRGDDFVRAPARTQRRQHADGARAASAARVDAGRTARGAAGAGAAAPGAERTDRRHRAPGRSEPADRDSFLPFAGFPWPGRFQIEVRQQPDRCDSGAPQPGERQRQHARPERQGNRQYCFRDSEIPRPAGRAFAGQGDRAGGQGQAGRVLRDGQFTRGGAGRPAQVLPLPHSDLGLWRFAFADLGGRVVESGRRGDRHLQFRQAAGSAGGG